MSDLEHDDHLIDFIDAIVDVVGILASAHLAYVVSLLFAAALGKGSDERGRSANGGADSAGGAGIALVR
jgi:hypothetical protein